MLLRILIFTVFKKWQRDGGRFNLWDVHAAFYLRHKESLLSGGAPWDRSEEEEEEGREVRGVSSLRRTLMGFGVVWFSLSTWHMEPFLFNHCTLGSITTRNAEDTDGRVVAPIVQNEGPLFQTSLPSNHRSLSASRRWKMSWLHADQLQRLCVCVCASRVSDLYYRFIYWIEEFHTVRTNSSVNKIKVYKYNKNVHGWETHVINTLGPVVEVAGRCDWPSTIPRSRNGGEN